MKKREPKHTPMATRQGDPGLHSTRSVDSARLKRDPVLRSFYGLRGRIGLLGGSFDPVQSAHLEIARHARQAANLDSVVFLPNYQNPLKNRQAAGASDRLEMLVLALQEEPLFFVCPMELEKNETAYTVDSVEEIHTQLEGKGELFFITGSDCLPDLHRWKNVHELLARVEFVILAREQDFSAARIPESVSELSRAEVEMLQRNVVSNPVSPVSSSAVRKVIAEGSVPYDMLPPGVGDYIAARGLYRP